MKNYLNNLTNYLSNLWVIVSPITKRFKDEEKTTLVLEAIQTSNTAASVDGLISFFEERLTIEQKTDIFHKIWKKSELSTLSLLLDKGATLF